jgi:hypothetical protein
MNDPSDRPIQRWVVSRIEEGEKGTGFALLAPLTPEGRTLEDSEREDLRVPLEAVPPETQEGTVLREVGGAEIRPPDVRFTLDPVGETLRREALAALRAQIPRGPRGALEL